MTNQPKEPPGPRRKIIGMVDGRLLTVFYKLTAEGRKHILEARDATAEERRDYETRSRRH